MTHAQLFNGISRNFRSAAIFALAVALGGATAAAQPIYHRGHGDLGIAYDAGALDLHYHFDSGALAEGGEAIADSEFAPSGIFTRVPGPSVPRHSAHSGTSPAPPPHRRFGFCRKRATRTNHF